VKQPTATLPGGQSYVTLGGVSGDSFHPLSLDRVLDAVEEAGFEASGHCSALNALENRVYDVRVAEGRHVVAKFYRPGRWSRAAIEEEHRLLLALAQHEIPVCTPLELQPGETLGEIEGIFYALWPRVGGRAPDELSDSEVAVLGRLLARIHDVGAALPLRHREPLGSDLVFAALEVLEDPRFLPPSCAARFRAASEQLAELLDRSSEGIPQHAIHGDCHVGNLLRCDPGWMILDFDDLRVGPAVQDVWMLVPGRDEGAARQRSLLVEAYREFRPFDERWLGLVEVLRGLRFVTYAGWIAKRWDDPSFPDAFPHFGSAQYWENETRDLEEQLVRAHSPTPAQAADAQDDREAPADVPGNEDFFWDL